MDFGSHTQKPGQLPPLHNYPGIIQHDQQYDVQANFAYSAGNGKNNISAMLFRQGGKVSQYNAPIHESPSRRFTKPANDAKISSDLLGAGDDPMAKHQEFSVLAGNPAALMKQNFKKP